MILHILPESQSPEREKQPLAASVLLHPGELMLKMGMQIAIHRDDESKLFPITVLPQNASLSLFLLLRDFGMFCPDSDSRRRAVLPWCSANPPILDEWSAIWKLEG